jgi:outer membrane lipoprotein
VISKETRTQAVKDVPFRIVKENIEKYKGSVFIWGGFIVRTRNTPEGTFIEVVQNPIDRYGSIVDTDISEGRFLALHKKYLDPLIYEKGRLITVAGTLIDSKKITRKKVEYVYPVLEVKELYLWKEEPIYLPYYRYWDLYPFWWHDPWWYDPYYPPPPY